jgi:hypothetical protein
MKPADPGERFILLLYQRSLAGPRRLALLLAVLLLGLWIPARLGMLDWPAVEQARWLLAGGLVAAAFWLYAQFAPLTAYVQARPDHLRVQTPIYRLKISYRRVPETRPIEFGRMFPPASQGGRKNWMAPFFGMTALGVDLYDWPLPRPLLRLFLDRTFLAPDRPGLVLLVDDWLRLSRQVNDRIDRFRQQAREAGPGGGRRVSEILDHD